MEDSLDRIKNGKPTDDVIVSFQECKVSDLALEEFIILWVCEAKQSNRLCIQDAVGFTSYASEEQRYKTD